METMIKEFDSDNNSVTSIVNNTGGEIISINVPVKK